MSPSDASLYLAGHAFEIRVEENMEKCKKGEQFSQVSSHYQTRSVSETRLFLLLPKHNTGVTLNLANRA